MSRQRQLKFDVDIQSSLTRREIFIESDRALKDTAKFKRRYAIIIGVIYMLRPHGFADEENNEYVKVRVRKKFDFYFINLDLELESTESVQPLIKELEDEILSAYCGDIDELGCLELQPYRNIEGNEVDLYSTFNDSEDEVGGTDIFINEFCELIENLSASSKKIWYKCHRKEFDLGFQCGNTPKTFKTRIQSSTISRCAELRASIMLTVYPHHNYDFISKKEVKKKKLKK